MSSVLGRSAPLLFIKGDTWKRKKGGEWFGGESLNIYRVKGRNREEGGSIGSRFRLRSGDKKNGGPKKLGSPRRNVKRARTSKKRMVAI